MNNVEIHSDKLYNVNVSNNKYLRKLDLSGCSTLGTVTATGSVLDVSNCKYLSYLNIYDTALTGVLLNTSGGSLKEIYYPKSIQEVQLIKQTLLEVIGLPYGNNGAEIPTSLYTVNIQECPTVKKLNTSDDDTINKTWISMKYCQNLTIRNALDFEEISLDGFQRLKILRLENMYKLKTLGFDDMLPVGNSSTLQYMGVSYCPALTDITMNCTSDDYEITFADGSLLNLSGATSLNSISSNCVIHGLETIVLPLSVEHLYFTNEYGTGYSSIKNIWSSRCCEINEEGILPVAIRYENQDFVGIDLQGVKLKDIDLGALVNIPDAINFDLSPTTVNPNFNINRDGVEYPYLQPQGVLNLSNYTESLARFFNGVDLDKLQLVCDNTLPQTDLSYCFYNSTFTSDDKIAPVLNNIGRVNNMEYCFYKTSVKDVSILNTINFINGTSLAYCFAECANLSRLHNITLSEDIGNAEYMFAGSGLVTIENVNTSCRNIKGMFSNCNNLVDVINFNANGTTSYESLFEGCNGMSVAPITVIPANITNISRMYKDCLGLVSIDGFVLHGNITEVDDFIAGCDNLVNANNVTISGTFYNDIFRGITSIKYVNNLLINYVGRSMTFANMFDGCTNLLEMSFHDDSYVKDVISMDYMFRGTSMRTVDFSNVNFEKVVSYKYMFADCLMEEFSYTVPYTIISIEGFLSGCTNLRTLRNFNINTNVSTNKWIDNTNIENLIDCTFNTQYTTFRDNTSLKTVQNVTYTGKDFSNYFNGCTNLQNVSVNITDATIKSENTFANCPKLVTVDFTDSDLTNVININGMFTNDTSLTTINNLKIVNSDTSANNTTLTACPISNTDGLYINSNSAIQMFRMGSESKITQFTDFELGTECNNLSDAFRDYPLLIKDITLPSHVINVSNTFNNCIAMENIVSNWTNSYDVNNDDDLDNDVVTEGCYEGSNNIKYIDGELYMNEYGELTAMDYIPQEWGGNASYEDNQTVFDVKITEDNLTYTMLGNIGECKTNWGDGTEDMNISHEYSKPGTYIIITENVSTFAKGTKLDTSISSPIVRFRALNKSLTKGSHLFDGWNNLLKINKLDNTFDSASYMFRDCSKLTSIDLSGCTFTSKVTNMSYLFMNCSKLSSVNFTIPEGVTDISYMFYGCKSMESISLNIPYSCQKMNYLFYMCTSLVDISDTVFEQKIVMCDNWYIGAPIIKANNVTIENNNIKFKNFNNLRELNNILITGNVTSLSDFASYTPQLKSFSFNPDSDLSNIVSISNAFYFAGNASNSLAEISFKGMNLSSLAFMDKTFYGNNTTLEKIDFSDCTFGNNTIKMVTPFFGNKKENIILDFSRTKMWKMTSYPEFIKGLTGCSMLFTGTDFEYTDSFNSIFKFNEGITRLTHVDFTDAIIPDHITDFTSMFESTGIDEDIIFPSTAQNVTKAFYGCTNITHVHSNWNNTYTNGITATDCYSGCINITHIDDVDVITYEGKEGLDEIPESWGGYGFTQDDTCVFKVDIPRDNYELILSGIPVTNRTEDTGLLTAWGDKTSSTSNYHIYEKAGIYVIKTKFNGCNTWNSNNTLRYCLTDILQTRRINCKMAIRDANNLKYWNLDNCVVTTNNLVYYGATNYGLTISSRNVVFKAKPWNPSDAWKTIIPQEDIDTWDISNLTTLSELFTRMYNTTIDLSNLTFNQNITGIYGMFNGCVNLEKVIGLEKIPTSKVTNTSNLFNNCKNLKNINGTENWDLSNSTINGLMLYNCSSLEQIDVSNWNMPNAKGSDGIFQSCAKLKTIIGIETLVDNRWYSITSLFRDCKSLPNQDLSRWDTSNVSTSAVTFQGCESMTEIDISNWNISNITNISGMFLNCYNLEKIIGVENLITENITNFNQLFMNCYKLKFDFCYTNGKPNWKFHPTGDGVGNLFMCYCGRDIALEDGEEYIIDLTDCGTFISTNCRQCFMSTPFTKFTITVDLHWTRTANGSVQQQDMRTFVSGQNLKELTIRGIMGNDLRTFVMGCPKLETVDFSELDFQYCLVNGNFAPFNGTDNIINLRWGTGYPVSFKLNNCTKLTVDSLMSVINNLPDLTGSTAQTLTLGSTNLAKLSSSQVAIATNKNWNVV